MGPITNKTLNAISYLLSGSPSSPAGKIALFAVRAFSIGSLVCLAFPKVGEYVWNWIKGPLPPRHPQPHSPPAASDPAPQAAPPLPPVIALPVPPASAQTQATPQQQPNSSALPPALAAAPAAVAASLYALNAQLPLAAATPKFKASEIFISQNLAAIRAPLKKYLELHIKLDTEGYPLPNQTQEMENLRNHLQATPSEIENLGEIFGQIASQGDAGYAHDIRTMLAGYEISSYQVSKLDGKKLINTRPHSYAQTQTQSQIEPPVYKGKIPGKSNYTSPYLDLWGYQIWVNYHLYRQQTFHFAFVKQKREDHPLTNAQLAHYDASLKCIQQLHKEGYLIGRVAIPEEPKQTAGHRPDMRNDILSTTLWPREGSLVQIQLFCESGLEETVGLLLDPKRVSQEDFGVALPTNGETAGSGYLNLKSRYKDEGAICLEAQYGLLDAFESIAQAGGNPSQVSYTLNPDKKGWTIQHSDARNTEGLTRRTRGRNTSSPLEVLWNEMTYYRGVSGDLLTGLFLKSDSESFSKELKKLFELQDHIRRTKGRFLPIFKFDGAKNQLTEIPPDKLLLNILGLTVKRQLGLPISDNYLCR